MDSTAGGVVHVHNVLDSIPLVKLVVRLQGQADARANPRRLGRYAHQPHQQ